MERGYENMEGYQKDPAPSNLCFFTVLILIIQGLGLTAVILVAVWMGHFRGGFDWLDDKLLFNYHPVFMIIGMVFLYADGILAYRVFRNIKKLYSKIIHASIYAAALIFASVGLKAVFEAHNLKGFQNLYSMHSWFGLLTVILFGLQWVFGFTSYLFPKLSYGLRSRYMPLHVFWGLAIFGLACVSALTGMTELTSNLFKGGIIAYDKFAPEGIVSNCLGLSVVLLAACVFYVATRSDYKRPAGPEEEEHIQLATN